MNYYAVRCSSPVVTASKFAFLLALGFSLLLPALTLAQVPLVRVSTDTFTNTNSQHQAEIEPDSLSFGSTIVTAFQVGRSPLGGASDTGWATSIDAGAHWTSGFLPGISKAENPANPYDLANDPGVGYDRAHGMWMIVTMPWAYAPPGSRRPPALIPAAIINRSPDGLNWGDPIIVTPNVPSSDKPWVTCDNTPTSPFYGHCYVEWNRPIPDFMVFMNTSVDGGLTWGPSTGTPDGAAGVGGLPLIQHSGRVIVPFVRQSAGLMMSFTSDDGGANWSTVSQVAKIAVHREAGNFRSTAMPSAEMDNRGRVYLVWQDCHYRANCSANDILLSTSDDGTTWRRPIRIPIDPVTSTVDHFLPGLAVDQATSGATAHLALVYYYFTNTDCTLATCQLFVGSITSADGGATWSAPVQMAGPMSLNWLPTTYGSPMLADYISTSFANHKAYSVFPVAHERVGSQLDLAMYANVNGIVVNNSGPRFSSAGDVALANIVSDIQGEDAEEQEEQAALSLPTEVFSVFPQFDFQKGVGALDEEDDYEFDVAH